SCVEDILRRVVVHGAAKSTHCPSYRPSDDGVLADDIRHVDSNQRLAGFAFDKSIERHSAQAEAGFYLPAISCPDDHWLSKRGVVGVGVEQSNMNGLRRPL